MEEYLSSTKFFGLLLGSALCYSFGPHSSHEVLPLSSLPPQMVAPKPPPFTIDEVVRASARKHSVDPAVVKSIIAAESDFQANVVSQKGAIGFMQLMPETAEELGWDAMNPEENIQAGTEYICWLMDRYKHKRNGLTWAIAAYNAGPGNVERYRGVPPFRETRNYVKRVLAYYKGFRHAAPAQAHAPVVPVESVMMTD